MWHRPLCKGLRAESERRWAIKADLEEEMLSASEIAVRISPIVGTPAEGTLIRSVYFCSQAETDREKEVDKWTGRHTHTERDEDGGRHKGAGP